jgi:hypothetical protein
MECWIVEIADCPSFGRRRMTLRRGEGNALKHNKKNRHFLGAG